MPHSSATDIITYRYEGKLVYVPVTLDCIEALSHARDAFPQLKECHDSALSFTLKSSTLENIRISAAAWSKVIQRVSRYQVIDVFVAHEYKQGDDRAKTQKGVQAVRKSDMTIGATDLSPKGLVNETEPVPPPYCGSDMTTGGKKVARQTPLRSPRRGWFFQKLLGWCL